MKTLVSRKPQIPPYLESLTRQVRESWELPGDDDFQAARDAYEQHLNEPIEEINAQRQIKVELVLSKIKEMVSIAPEMFRQALEGTAFEPEHTEEREDQDVN